MRGFTCPTWCTLPLPTATNCFILKAPPASKPLLIGWGNWPTISNSPSWPTIPKGSILTSSWMCFTDNMLCPSKSSMEPRSCPCPSTVDTLCSKTHCVSSKCPYPPFPKPLDSRNKRRVSSPTFSTHPTIKTTWDLYLTRHTTILMACPSHKCKNSNDGTHNTIPNTSLISKPNSWPIVNPMCCLPSLLSRIQRDQRFQSPGTLYHHRLCLQSLLPHQTHVRTSPGLQTRQWMAWTRQTVFPRSPGMADLFESHPQCSHSSRLQWRGTCDSSRWQNLPHGRVRPQHRCCVRIPQVFLAQMSQVLPGLRQTVSQDVWSDHVWRLQSHPTQSTHFVRHGLQCLALWECEWEEKKKSDNTVQTFVDSFGLVSRLQPRVAFSRGLTNAIKLHRRAVDGEKIHYHDFTSLYPWTNQNCFYPVGHPEIHFEPRGTNISSYFGLVKCKILPPYGLYHPVLPYRSGGKLVFPLCRACVEKEQPKPLTKRSHHRVHTKAEGCLVGTRPTRNCKKLSIEVTSFSTCTKSGTSQVNALAKMMLNCF